ncbi:hypothetical protein ABZX85_44040 [Streptomyces sp. NPDC004539]|uniref:hypothetical protein n=1 Tax=Streptomyces sp. NPDC004539 TaxID=3154280 RepID=UPI0033ACAD52
MRDAIARALTWALLAFTPRRRPGRHSSTYLTAQPAALGPVPVSPWSRPWTSPTKEEAAALFRRQAEAETERELRLQRERRQAAALAALGIDHPYTYDGAPFGPDAFHATQAASA